MLTLVPDTAIALKQIYALKVSVRRLVHTEMQEDPKLISSNRHTKSATTYGRLLSENSRHLSLP